MDERQKLPATRNPFTYFKRVIISIDTLKSDRYQANLRKQRWDAVVIDESHNLSNSATLNNLYLAHEDKFVITPVGRVFELYANHQGGNALRAVFSAPGASLIVFGTFETSRALPCSGVAVVWPVLPHLTPTNTSTPAMSTAPVTHGSTLRQRGFLIFSRCSKMDSRLTSLIA